MNQALSDLKSAITRVRDSKSRKARGQSKLKKLNLCWQIGLKHILMMTKLTLEIPDNVELTEHDAKMLLAGKLYEQEKLTLSQAAAFAGIAKRTFIEEIGQYGFSLKGDFIGNLRSDTELLSENTLGKDWHTEEEDQAWQHLQKGA